MSGVTFHFPRYRLASMLKQPGGIAVADAIKAANQGLASIQSNCVEAVGGMMEQINGHWSGQAGSPDRKAMQELYRLTNALVGVADAAGLLALDRAAYSLCDLLDRMITAGRCDRDSLDVHVQALNLLHRPEFAVQATAVREVLLGLREVRDRFTTGAVASASRH